MANQVEDIRKCEFTKDDCLFLDTNVWIYIHYGIYSKNADQRERNRFYKRWYTNAFNKMREKGSKIFVDALVLSEFINRYSHLEYDRMMPDIKREPNKNNYKIFRNSKDGRDTAQAIVINTNKILKEAQFCNLDYSFIRHRLSAHLEDYKKYNSDFNDLIYIDLCRNNGYKLVTHDGDFKNCDIHILTANNELLG